jgi:salicylate hydroxylase
MAYRAIFDRQTLKGLNQPVLTEIINSEVGTAWMGPNGHVIIYPVRQGEQLNMVLIGPDVLPEGVKTGVGTLEDVKKAYDGWDSALVIS